MRKPRLREFMTYHSFILQETKAWGIGGLP